MMAISATLLPNQELQPTRCAGASMLAHRVVEYVHQVVQLSSRAPEF